MCLRAKFTQFTGQVHLGARCKDEVGFFKFIVFINNPNFRLQILFWKLNSMSRLTPSSTRAVNLQLPDIVQIQLFRKAAILIQSLSVWRPIFMQTKFRTRIAPNNWFDEQKNLWLTFIWTPAFMKLARLTFNVCARTLHQVKAEVCLIEILNIDTYHF